MNGIKYLSFLLLLSFSVFLGHSLVPHHHHAENLKSAVDSSCPIDHEDHHEANKDQMHCHAFNNVNFYQYSDSYIQQSVREIISLMVPLSMTKIESSTGFESFRYIELIIPANSAICRGAISLRAPPVSV